MSISLLLTGYWLAVYIICTTIWQEKGAMMAKNTGIGSRYGAGLHTEGFRRTLDGSQSMWAPQLGTTGRFTDVKANGGDFAAVAKRRRKNGRRRWFRRFW